MVSQDIIESLDRYVNHRIAPGGFLLAVLRNDLFDAVSRADVFNQKMLKEIVQYVYWDIPYETWGSAEKVNNWLAGE